VPGNVSYTSPLFKSRYVLNTNPLSFEQAEIFCNENGGHLASWESLQEQRVRCPWLPMAAHAAVSHYRL
jgi:hypothetical protein